MKNIKISRKFTLKELLQTIKNKGFDEYMKIGHTKEDGYNAIIKKINKYLDIIT
jgi:hypothetical protein